MRHGQGTHLWPNGKKYQGDWFHNSQTGYGVMSWANGEKYDGQWKDDMRHGQGNQTCVGEAHRCTVV
ncbi:hypothetical protein I4U23_005565 [Adineta vaga]|nr:hypothetical protein I4U23_005565 [Adineta vaga]